MNARVTKIHNAPNASTRLSESTLTTAGLDIGGTKIHGVLVAPGGDVIASLQVATRRGHDGVVHGAADVVEMLVAKAGLRIGDLAAVGAGVPGIVDPNDGVVRHAVNLGVGETPLPLADRLATLLGIPAVIDNDLNVAALGAAHLTTAGVVSTPVTAAAVATGGSTRPNLAMDLAYLSLGTGLAAGLVLDGVVRRGTGIAGEIGHIPFDPTGPVCPCGQRGCLELYGSGSAIESAWPATSGRPAAVELFEAAAAGNSAAVAVRDRYADAVAGAVRVLALSLDPRQVLLGGGVTRLGRPLLDVVRDALRRQSKHSPFLAAIDLPSRVALVPAGVPVAALGAAVLARS